MPPKQLNFVTLDVFTSQKFSGNPLALVRIPQDINIPTPQLQLIAREFNLSETIFLHERSIAEDGVSEWQVRIFLTNAEIPFAGHPSIGAACYALGTLANGGSTGRLICNAGPIEVNYTGGVASLAIPHNVHVHTEFRFSLEQVHELQPALRGRPAPLAVETISPVKGMNFVCVELPDLEALSLIETTGVPVAPTLDTAWNVGFAGSYFYTITDQRKGRLAVQSRMVERALEDPATGSAACGLCAYLALRTKQKQLQVQVTQGVEMKRRSGIGVVVTLNDILDAVERIELSGTMCKVMEGVIDYA